MSESTALAFEVIRGFRDSPPATPTAGARGRTRQVPQPVADPIAAGPATTAPTLDLGATLARRRSERFFGPGPVTPGDVLDIVAAGIRIDAQRWPMASATEPLEVFVVAGAVAGVPQCILAVNLEDRALVPVTGRLDHEVMDALTVQSEYAKAAAIISFACDLTAAVESSGGQGYRTSLVRCGAVAYTCWLEAVSRGLEGTVFAGFIPASVRRVLRSDVSSRHQVFAVALGHPSRAAQAETTSTPRPRPGPDTGAGPPASPIGSPSPRDLQLETTQRME